MNNVPDYSRRVQKPKLSCDLPQLKVGFARFFAENGRLPTSHEITECPYLPSARQINRRYGSLAQVRELLGYSKADLRHAAYRPVSASITTTRGYREEEKVRQVLVERFGQHYVHLERPYGQHRTRLDFYVFNPDGDFGVDVFFTDSGHTFDINVNIKLGKYTDYPVGEELYFVCTNSQISQEYMDERSNRIAKMKLLPLLRLVTLDNFIKIVSQKRRYSDPVVESPELPL